MDSQSIKGFIVFSEGKVELGIRKRIKFMLDGWFGPLPHPEKWVFIVGCYNSGTTLLHDLLATRQDVGSMRREGQRYTDQLTLPQSVGLPRLWALEPNRFYLSENDDSVNVNKLKRQWGASFDDPKRPILIEKSPTNAARMRWLQRNFRNAYFIGIIRNGYAVAEGIHRKAGHTIIKAATQWSRSNEIMLSDFEALRCKKLIRYEILTASPDKVLREIFEFLGLEYEDVNVVDQIWHVHERASVIKNMNQRSFDVLTAEDYQLIESVAGYMLTRLGYSRKC